MLTSMVKRVDRAVYDASKAFRPGLTVLGLEDGGVDYALDEFNARLVTPAMKTRVETARADIVGGRIKVADYMADNACKY
jgi:basic membrane protein A